MSIDVFLDRFEAYFGYFGRLYVPASLRVEPFRDQKRDKNGPNCVFPDARF